MPGGTHTPRKRALRQQNSAVSTDGLSDVALSDVVDSPSGARVHANGHVSPAGLPLAGGHCSLGCEVEQCTECTGSWTYAQSSLLAMPAIGSSLLYSKWLHLFT